MADKTILPYRRDYVELEGIQPVKEVKTNPLSKINGNILFLHLIAFLLGRAGILQGLTPFGIAFFTALIQKDRKYALTGITVFLGIVTAQGLLGSLTYGLSLGLTYILFYYLLDIKKMKLWTISALGGLSYLLISIMALSFGTFYTYDFMMAAFEALVIFVTIYISSYAIPVALQKNSRKILSTEEIICVAIMTALTLSGINDMYIIDLSIKNILGILLTILFAYNGGASIGASVGVTLGLITSMSNGSTPVIIGIFAFSGLLAGIFKDIGRFGSAFGFLMGNAILTFYINGYYEVFLQFKEVVVAFFLFLLVPKAWIIQLEKFCNTRSRIINSSKSHSDRMQRVTYERLKECAVTFEELASTFESIAEKQELFAQEDLSELIERVANEVCTDCGMKTRCWDKSFPATYQEMTDLLLHIETKGVLYKDDLPTDFMKRCIRTDGVIDMITHLYELSHLNMIWKQRLLESRELAGQQLKSVSKVIGELAQSINEEVKFDVDLEDAIYVALDKENISVKNLMVSSGEKGNLEITVEKKPCYNREVCYEKIMPIIAEVVGTPLLKKTRNCNRRDHEESCSFTLIEANRYGACTKLASVTKEGNGISGDSYSFMDIQNGQYMAAISDGMGTGKKAHMQSSATITMLEKMMEAGFDRRVALKTINSMLMLKSSEEMFSTIDMTLFDLHRGRADFIKIGSAPSFIKRNTGEVEEISAASLPIGILTDIQIEESREKLEDGDFIVMISDGILDANKNTGERWLVDFLEKTHTRNPQELADKILHEALKYSDTIAEDDMTVLVTKVWEVT